MVIVQCSSSDYKPLYSNNNNNLDTVCYTVYRIRYINVLFHTFTVILSGLKKYHFLCTEDFVI